MGELLHSDDRVQQTDDWNRVKGETCNKVTKSKMTNCLFVLNLLAETERSSFMTCPLWTLTVRSMCWKLYL